MKRIILTGGGTAGHVTPNLALIPTLKKEGWEIHYIGTADGIEKRLIEAVDGVTYHSVKSGKLRRYFDVKNFTDENKPDYICGVPDSGTPHAIGYANKSGIPFARMASAISTQGENTRSHQAQGRRFRA